VVTDQGDRDSGIIVVKEAAAAELPCLGTRHGGLPEIVDEGETGFLVAERDVDALAGRLGSLLSEPELRRRQGRAARRKMEREYDIRSRSVELEEIYDEVVSNAPA
jgi:glycosyltransferase involved in cell wall biosynthesis